MITIYDKASWQVEGGMDVDKVIAHFVTIFEWLHSKKMLNNEGSQFIEIGIDDSISLNEEMVTKEGNQFLSKYYDKIISESNYDKDIEKKLLDSYYKEFCK